MFKDLIEEKALKKLPFFQKNGQSVYLSPYADLIVFLCEIFIIATCFVLLENGLNVFKEGLFAFFDKIFNGVYFVMTTTTTVGYGDISPTNVFSKFFVVVFVFIYLSSRLIRILGSFVDAKNLTLEYKRIGRLFMDMKDHIIVYCDAETIKRDNFLWLKRFVQENKKSTKYRNNKILLVNHNEDAIQLLNDGMTSNNNFEDRVSHLNLNINESDFFNKISIANAEHIYVLGNPNDTHSDSKVFDFVYRVEIETPYKKDVTAEIVNDNARKRMYDVGVDVIMRPNRSYPEMLVTATIGRGTASVLEELSSRGNDTLEVFKIPDGIDKFQWLSLLFELSKNSIGTAIGVVYENNVDVNPNGNDIISDAKGVVLMVYEMHSKSYEDIQNKINEIFNNLKEV